MVAFALVAATVLKGILDYAGTYLVNYAGFAMITDLRNELYSAILRRSVAFFHKHSTGTLLSAIVNDIERCSTRFPRCWPNRFSNSLPCSSPWEW